jgi:protein-tyrosine-phosphatase
MINGLSYIAREHTQGGVIMDKKRVLYVCTYHGTRSRLAEQYHLQYATAAYIPFSASFEPGSIGGLAAIILRETGIDPAISDTKCIFDRYCDHEQFDYVITLSDEKGKEQSPVFRRAVDQLYGKTSIRQSWSIRDIHTLQGSSEKQLEQARIIRNQIRNRVITFLDSLEAGKYQSSHFQAQQRPVDTR